MSLYSDFRFLAAKDIDHRQLRWMPDVWWAANVKLNGWVVLVEYDTDLSPLVACALEPLICPVDPDATLRILYWVGNVEEKEAKLEPAFVKSSLAIIEQMKKLGHTKIWGFAPKASTHVCGFLDKVVLDNKCESVDGDELVKLLGEGKVEFPFQGHNFYVADITNAENYMKGQP